MAILGVIASAGLIRVVRAVTIAIREDLYIRAARVFGLSHGRIVTRHVLPRIAGTVIVQAGLFAGLALVVQSGLAFLGFGVVLPKPSWGGLLERGVAGHAPLVLAARSRRRCSRSHRSRGSALRQRAARHVERTVGPVPADDDLRSVHAGHPNHPRAA